MHRGWGGGGVEEVGSCTYISWLVWEGWNTWLFSLHKTDYIPRCACTFCT